MSHLIAASILNADFGNLAREIEMINQSQADWFHLDIMDGVFVPNISFGFPVIEALKKYATKPLDVHLMIVEPDKYVDRFCDAGAHLVNVHLEACTHLHRTIHSIKAKGVKAGATLNPHTPICLLKDVIQDLDLVLLMSVNPGFGGQAFIERTYQRIEELKELILKNNSKAVIQVDGGVDQSNVMQLVLKGADVLVVGSFIFRSEDPRYTISRLKQPV
jgi:ribulose-phosphate 3-epimerase